MMPSHSDPVVIVGGGFAGATLAQQLEKTIGDRAEVVVVSKDNHLVFTPMLPEVAGRTISPVNVVVPGRQVSQRTRWVAADVTSVDARAKTLRYLRSDGREETTRFSHLVLACGMGVNLDMVPGLAAHALPLKSVTDAFTIGNEVITRFEQAAAVTETDNTIRQQLLTAVVIGGGFSGVEIAGHLFDLMLNVRRFYPQLSYIEPTLVLLQRGDRILPELQHQSLSTYTARKLSARGVTVRLGCTVREVTVQHVLLEGGERIPYGLVIGTVGNEPHAFLRQSGLPLEGGRISAGPDMRVEGFDDVWAIGDCARVPNAYDNTVCPPTAQFAIRQARQLARNLRRVYDGEPLAAFRHRSQGLLASIGQRSGVAEIYGLRFSGFVAWFLWRGVYLAKIPTLARKLGVALDWCLDTLFPANTVRVGEDLGRVRRQHFAHGDTVYRPGDPVRFLYLIERGTATVQHAGIGGPLATLRAGDYFGTSAVRGNARVHTTEVSAASALDVVVLDRSSVDAISRYAPNKELARAGVVQDIWRAYADVVNRTPDIARVRVRDVMTTPRTIGGRETIHAALDAVTSVQALAVVDQDGTFSGYCGRDELIAALARGLSVDTPVKEASDDKVNPLRADQSLIVAVSEVLRAGRDSLPVTDDGRHVVGMLGALDGLRALGITAAGNGRWSHNGPMSGTCGDEGANAI
jgi:NADH:ubiquinone reductase (H+-translocating)